jgi:hypothetical protein
VPQKLLPAVFAIWCDQQLVAALRPAGRRALLPRLLASIDALIQAVDSYHESYRRVFGRRHKGKKETPERAVNCRHAATHDLVSRISPALLTSS